MRRWLAVLISLAAGTAPFAQTAPLVVHVTETAGIRRTTYPVGARVEIPSGALADLAHVRLRLNGSDVPAQFQAASRWPDGSVRLLDGDFNATIGPHETADYVVDYGANVTAPPAPRGLAVTESEDAIQIGSVAFSKSASPLIRTVKYREEEIGRGPNGAAIVDASGQAHELAVEGSAGATVVKRGPLYAVIRYAGQVSIDAARRIPFTLTVEMPNSKTWIKTSVDLDDNDASVRAVLFRTPLSLGPYPWLWDFGTTNATYGVFRAAGDSATLGATTKANGRVDWRAESSSGGRPAQLLESATDDISAARWGHISDGKEVVAFAIDHASEPLGSTTMAIDGAGQLSIRFAPAQPVREHHLVVYEHFVTSPVQIGAATTPAAMLAPLAVR